MAKLVQVLYSSSIVSSDVQETINSILTKARQRNEENGITGMLLYRNGEFLQLLEGERMNVYYTLKKIRDDQRHRNMKIIFEGEVTKRAFEGWQMAFKSEKEENPSLQKKVLELIESETFANNLDLINLLNKFYFLKVG